MPIRFSGLDDAKPQSGIGSFLMLGERNAGGVPGDLSTISDTTIYNNRYLFQTLELSGNAPGIDIPIVSDTPADFPSQQGPLDIINGFTLPNYVEKLQPFYRQLTNDPRALDPTGTTEPTLDTTEIGGRDGTSAADAVADGLAFTAGAGLTQAGSALTQANLAQVTGAPSGTNVFALTIDPNAAFTGTLTVTGTDYNDVQFNEVFTFTGANAVHGRKYFKTITQLVASAAVTVDIGLSQDENARRYTSIYTGDDAGNLLHGIDVYAQKGEVPNTYRETYINGMSFSFSRDGGVALAFTCVGKRPITNTFIDNAFWDGVTPTPANIASLTDRANRTTYPLAKRQAAVGWQCGLFYGTGAGDRLALIDTTFNFNNNVAFSPTVTGRRTPGGAFRTIRNVTLEGTMEYRKEDSSLVNDVLGNEFLENAWVEIANITTGGFPYRTQYRFGRLQFTNLPDAPVSDAGLISRPVSMKSVPSEDDEFPDVYIREETLNPQALRAIAP